MMEPVIADLSEKYTDVVFLKVDADECKVSSIQLDLAQSLYRALPSIHTMQQTAESQEIVAYPTFVFFKNKQELQRVCKSMQ